MFFSRIQSTRVPTHTTIASVSTFVPFDWPKSGSPLHTLLHDPKSIAQASLPTRRDPMPVLSTAQHLSLSKSSRSSLPSLPRAIPGFVDELGRRVTHDPAVGPSPFSPLPDHPVPVPEPVLAPIAKPSSSNPTAKKATTTIPKKSLLPHFPPLHTLTPYLLSLLFPPPSLVSPKALHSELSSTSFVSQETASR